MKPFTKLLLHPNEIQRPRNESDYGSKKIKILQRLIQFSFFQLASYYNSYRVPPITEDYRAVLALWRKLMKPIINPLFSIAVAQALVAMWITYCEATSYYEVQAKLNMESDVTKELKY